MPEVTQLHGAIRAVNDPVVVMQRVVDQALDLIGPAEGVLLGLVRGGEFSYVCGAGNLPGRPGLQPTPGRSLAGAAVATGEPQCCVDATVDERVDPDAFRLATAASAICVPLLRGRETIGVLTVTASVPAAFSSAHVAALGRLADFIGGAVGAMCEVARVTRDLLDDEQAVLGAEPVGRFVANVLQPGLVSELATRQRIEHVLREPGLTMRCQPIVDVTTGALVGAEALARFSGPPQRPDVWFGDAERVGLGVPLQMAAVAAALEIVDQLPEDAFLAINVGPDVIAGPELLNLLDGVAAERIVLELTEHLQIDDYSGLHKRLDAVRRRGTRLAVDDTGAGFSSLGHIVQLAPELIKLDRQFTRGIDVDPVRRSLAGALVTFAREVSADVVAEGIETAAELETVRELGIPYGQGYFIGRPMPASLLAAHVAHAQDRAQTARR